jgi:ADP-ribosyl-[dinitrogen reductase] hydrolase
VLFRSPGRCWADCARRMPGDEHIRGALLGLAVGDALGAQVEFAAPEIARRLVADGLEMADSRYWAAGQWTDDTALALELAESIAGHGLLSVDDVARRYIRWANTDGRGIGRATRAALVGAGDAADARRRAAAFHAAAGMGAGNGTVMRCTPIGLAAADVDEARRAAYEDARLTHGHPAAPPASAALCAAILAVRDGDDPVTAARDEARGQPELEHAIDLASAADREALAAMAVGPAAGACWTSVSIALHALAHLDEYEPGIAWVISLGGDTDTNAAVAGALIGFRHGPRAIPERWVEPLAERDRIERAAAALAGRHRRGCEIGRASCRERV